MTKNSKRLADILERARIMSGCRTAEQFEDYVEEVLLGRREPDVILTEDSETQEPLYVKLEPGWTAQRKREIEMQSDDRRLFGSRRSDLAGP